MKCTAPILLLFAIPLFSQTSRQKPKMPNPPPLVDVPMPKDLQECASIKDDRLRLASYDKFALAQKTAAAAFRPEERQSAEICLKSLRKLQTATKIGLNKAEYGRQVIEMAQAVDEAISQLSNSSLRQLIKEARDDYAEAQTAWDFSFQAEYVEIFENSEIGKRLDKKYGLRFKDLGGTDTSKFAKIKYRFLILNPVWSSAGRRILVANELLKRNLPNDPTAIEFISSIDKYQRAVWTGEPSEDLKKAIPDWQGITVPSEKP